MSLLSNIQILTNGDAALGAITTTGVLIQLDGLFGGATVSLMSSTDGGATFNDMHDFTAADLLRYDGAVGEILKFTTSGAASGTFIQVTIR